MPLYLLPPFLIEGLVIANIQSEINSIVYVVAQNTEARYFNLKHIPQAPTM
jgi:hypothetical protein